MKFKHVKYDFRFKKKRTISRIKIKRFVSRPIVIATALLFIVTSLTVGLFFIFHNSTQKFIAPINDRIVIISHDHVVQIVPSKERTVGALLTKLHIVLYQGDVVEPSLDTVINQDDFRINIYRAVPVEIVDGNMTYFGFSAAKTPRAIAQQQGLKVYPADQVSIKPVNNFLSSYAIGEQVVVKPAIPVYLNLYGNLLSVRTQAKTVGQFIKMEKIHLSASDQVEPALNSPITVNSQIFIIRHGIKIQTVTNIIPMPVQVVYDANLAYGTGAIRQQGSNGQEAITYQEEMSNNVVVNKVVLQDIITEQPVTQIEVEGTSLSGIKGDMALAGIAPSDYQYADYIISHESGWCPTKAQGEHYCLPIPDNPMTPLGYGLCQATPGYKMASEGSDWATNPVTQLRWCNSYAQNRYGGWSNAYNHWYYYHWW